MKRRTEKKRASINADGGYWDRKTFHLFQGRHNWATNHVCIQEINRMQTEAGMREMLDRVKARLAMPLSAFDVGDN